MPMTGVWTNRAVNYESICKSGSTTATTCPLWHGHSHHMCSKYVVAICHSINDYYFSRHYKCMKIFIGSNIFKNKKNLFFNAYTNQR